MINTNTIIDFAQAGFGFGIKPTGEGVEVSVTHVGTGRNQQQTISNINAKARGIEQSLRYLRGNITRVITLEQEGNG